MCCECQAKWKDHELIVLRPYGEPQVTSVGRVVWQIKIGVVGVQGHRPISYIEGQHDPTQGQHLELVLENTQVQEAEVEERSQTYDLLEDKEKKGVKYHAPLSRKHYLYDLLLNSDPT